MRILPHFVAALLASLCLAQPSPDRVDRIFSAWDKTSSPGCALGVIQDGRLVYKRGYGMADLDHDIAISPSSVFHVASVSKQFTAASIVLLAGRGKLSLDDPVRKHIAELPDFGQPLTIRHLLHHTSGLRDQWSMLILSGWRLSEDVVRDADVLDIVARMKELNFPPGEMHIYCNTGYTLLAEIVKRVSGKSLRAFTNAEIFEPLGMHSTHFRDEHQETVKGMAYGYVPERGGGFRQSIPHYDTVGASSLLTTVEDMARWDQNFRQPKIGGPDFFTRMLQPFRLNNGETIDYRFGLVEGKYKGLRIVEHSGGDAGYRSHYIQFPDERFSVVCLCNVSNNPGRLARDVADLYLAGKIVTAPAPPKEELTPVTLSAEQLAAHAGLYWNASDEEIRRFLVRDGKLMLKRGIDVELVGLAANRFRPKGESLEITFHGDSAEESAAGRKPDVFRRVAAVELNSAQAAEYSGNFYSDELDSTYRIELRDGKLSLHRKKLRVHTLEPTFRDAFYAPLLGYLRFERDSAGRITGFRLTSGRIRNLKFAHARQIR